MILTCYLWLICHKNSVNKSHFRAIVSSLSILGGVDCSAWGGLLSLQIPVVVVPEDLGPFCPGLCPLYFLYMVDKRFIPLVGLMTFEAYVWFVKPHIWPWHAYFKSLYSSSKIVCNVHIYRWFSSCQRNAPICCKQCPPSSHNFVDFENAVSWDWLSGDDVIETL